MPPHRVHSFEQSFRLQRPVATFVALVSGFVLGALLLIAAYHLWSGGAGLELPTSEGTPWVLEPQFFFPFSLVFLGLSLWAALWTVPYEIGVGPNESIRVRTPLRERKYAGNERVGAVRVLVVCHRLAAGGDNFVLLPEFNSHEALFAFLKRRTEEAAETGET